jgi:hypothetical protein
MSLTNRPIQAISRPVKLWMTQFLGQWGVRSLGLLMLGKGPPKLPFSSMLPLPRKSAASLCTSYGIFSCIVYGKSSVSVRQTLDDLVLESTDLLSTNRQVIRLIA